MEEKTRKLFLSFRENIKKPINILKELNAGIITLDELQDDFFNKLKNGIYLKQIMAFLDKKYFFDEETIKYLYNETTKKDLYNLSEMILQNTENLYKRVEEAKIYVDDIIAEIIEKKDECSKTIDTDEKLLMILPEGDILIQKIIEYRLKYQKFELSEIHDKYAIKKYIEPPKVGDIYSMESGQKMIKVTMDVLKKNCLRIEIHILNEIIAMKSIDECEIDYDKIEVELFVDLFIKYLEKNDMINVKKVLTMFEKVKYIKEDTGFLFVIKKIFEKYEDRLNKFDLTEEIRKAIMRTGIFLQRHMSRIFLILMGRDTRKYEEIYGLIRANKAMRIHLMIQYIKQKNYEMLEREKHMLIPDVSDDFLSKMVFAMDTKGTKMLEMLIGKKGILIDHVKRRFIMLLLKQLIGSFPQGKESTQCRIGFNGIEMMIPIIKNELEIIFAEENGISDLEKYKMKNKADYEIEWNRFKTWNKDEQIILIEPNTFKLLLNNNLINPDNIKICCYKDMLKLHNKRINLDILKVPKTTIKKIEEAYILIKIHFGELETDLIIEYL